MAGFDRSRPIEYVATGAIVHDNKLLLVRHKKLKLWLPPGGHIEKGELPSECVVREVKEETGLDVEIIRSAHGEVSGHAIPVPAPDWTQLEDIQGTHWHFDFIYVCRVRGGALQKNDESEDARFFSAMEVETLKDTTEEVKAMATILLK